MRGSIWVHGKIDNKIDFRFQISGIKRGAYTKILDPTFKGWKEVGSGYNYKLLTELTIYSKAFESDEEMVNWVKKNVTFPTVYDKCNTKCTTKILVAEKIEANHDKTKASKNRAKNP